MNSKLRNETRRRLEAFTRPVPLVSLRFAYDYAFLLIKECVLVFFCYPFIATSGVGVLAYVLAAINARSLASVFYRHPTTDFQHIKIP